MALTSQDAWAVGDAAEKAGRILMLGYSFRYLGIWRSVKRVLDEGALGTIRQISLAFCVYRRWNWEVDTMAAYVQSFVRGFGESVSLPFEFFADHGRTWHRDPAKMGGGMFADTGSHWVDLSLWLGGAQPVQVVADYPWIAL